LPTGVTLTAGDGEGATFAFTVTATGADSLEPGTYECVVGTSNIVQYIGATFDTYQSVSGACAKAPYKLAGVGDSVGDHVTGSFTATLIKKGGRHGYVRSD
jgi:hypothetical protein